MTNILFTPNILVAALHHVQRHQQKYLQGWNEGQIINYLLKREARGELFIVVDGLEVSGLAVVEPLEDYLYVKGISAVNTAIFKGLVGEIKEKFGGKYQSFLGYRRGRAKIWRDGIKLATRLTRN